MIDLTHIIEKYTINKYDKTYCYVPCGAKKLIILLSAHNQYGKYFLFRSFLENQKYDFLFITDNNSWYLDDNYGKNYIRIFSEYVDIYGNDNIVVFGSSMGGYGAVLFASELGIHCLVCNPQIDLQVSKDWAWEELRIHIDKIVNENRHVDIIRKLETYTNHSVFFLIYGNNPLDVINANIFLTMCKNEKKFIVYQYDGDTHEFPFGRDIESIYNCIDMIFLYSKFNINVEKNNEFMNNNREKRRKNGVYELFEMNKYFYKHSLWSIRSTINEKGIYLFSDIGIKIRNNFSGVIAYMYDDNKYYMIFPTKEFLMKHGKNFLLENKGDKVINNMYIYENCWTRILDNTEVFFENKFIKICNIYNKNMFFNFVLNDIPKNNNFNIIPITCYIDLEIDYGEITVSIVYINKDKKYISINKKINKSGKYTIYGYCYDILCSHSNALSFRIYPCLDLQPKKMRINKVWACCGLLPFINE